MRKKHISTEIFTYVFLGFLFIIIIVSGIFMMYQREIVQEKVDASISGILNQTSNTLVEKLERSEALASTLKLNATILEVLNRTPNYTDAKKMDQIISDMRNSKIWGEEYITIVGRRGHIFVNWDNDGRSRYSKEIEEMKDRLLSETDILNTMPFERFAGYTNPDQYDKNKKLIGVSSLIYDYTSQKVGIITVSIPEKSMLGVMESNKLFRESEVCLIDREGKILLTTAADQTGQYLDMTHVMEEEEKYTSGNVRINHGGKRMMVFYHTLNSEWTQVIMLPYAVYNKEMRLMAVTFGLVGIVAMVLSVMISFAISYSISKPIKQLEQSIDQITRGDLKNRVQVVRSDDIGKLGEHFNTMADNLEHLIEEKISIQKRASELVIANKTAELKMLHAQINPHFLFNTLNSIRCIAIINKAEYIARMLESLGALLENSIMKGRENTFIEKEVELLKKYIELQQMRYGKRLKAEFLVDEEIYHYEIPRFMLQPLLENAITHGIADKIEGGTITISGIRNEQMLMLEVKDDGVGIGTAKKNGGHGIAILNIRERLRLIYGENCSLDIQPGEGGQGTIAILVLPAKVYGGDNDA